jgi:hypothetical protein
MSRVYLAPVKDTSIYSASIDLNTGYDEILEVGKFRRKPDLDVGPVRSLIQFDLSDLKGAPTSSGVCLNLKVAHAEKLFQDEFIYIHQVSQSWDEGSGYIDHTPYKSQDGATWRWNSSASYWDVSGSDFNATPVVSASVAELTNDELRIDVTSLIAPMISGSQLTDNYGLLIKFSGSSETNDNNEGNIKFFSRQTHTVHEPRLELVWLNQTFTTGSLDPLTSFDIEVAPKNLKEQYTKGEVSKLYFTVRDKYPTKTYTNTSRFSNKYYLPSGSQFTIVDAAAGTTIIPFDEYSHVDCDGVASYIKLDTDPLYKNRFYDVKLKVTLNEEIFYTTTHRFKVI